MAMLPKLVYSPFVHDWPRITCIWDIRDKLAALLKGLPLDKIAQVLETNEREETKMECKDDKKRKATKQ